MNERVEKAIKDMKEGKSGGIDGITMALLKAGETTAVEYLTTTFNACLSEGQPPKERNVAKLILLFKMGDKKELQNCMR